MEFDHLRPLLIQVAFRESNSDGHLMGMGMNLMVGKLDIGNFSTESSMIALSFGSKDEKASGNGFTNGNGSKIKQGRQGLHLGQGKLGEVLDLERGSTWQSMGYFIA